MVMRVAFRACHERARRREVPWGQRSGKGHGECPQGCDSASEVPVQKGSRPVRVSTEECGAWRSRVQPAARATDTADGSLPLSLTSEQLQTKELKILSNWYEVLPEGCSRLTQNLGGPGRGATHRDTRSIAPGRDVS